MRSFVIIFDSNVSIDQVKEFSISYGGVLTAEFDRVTISNINANIYIDFYHELNEFDSREIVFLHKLLNKPPRSYISIHVGHATDSSLLAKQFAISICDKYNAIIWDDECTFNDRDKHKLNIVSDVEEDRKRDR